MSLLLDALKRAEQEKLARGGEPEKPAPRPPERSGFETESPRLAPISAPVLELQPVDNRESAIESPSSPSADARAVQNAFAAKSPAPPAGRQRMALWAGLAAIVVVVAAAGGYIWYSIQQLTPPPFAARTRLRPPAAPIPPAASAEPSSAAKMEQLVALANAKPPLPGQGGSASTATTTVTTTPAPAPAPAVATVTAVTAPAPSPAQKTLESMLRNAERPPAGDAFSMQRSNDKPHVLKQVSAGYDALALGDLDRARREYGEAARAEPDNIDAQLGLATVEARAGHRALAASLYHHALELDPREPTALAGLAALSAAGGAPEGLESQLRSDIARGENAGLYFSLGNLYAGQARWSEAQAAYFDAHRLEPGSADILFNLAVSLDHLGQARLALGYYEQALDMSTRRAAQFDAAAVAHRVAELRAAKQR